jgi:hypothetical protein
MLRGVVLVTMADGTSVDFDPHKESASGANPQVTWLELSANAVGGLVGAYCAWC